MRKSLFILLLLVSFQSNAQVNSSISFSPLTLLANPIVRFGYEVELIPKTYFQVEIGYGKNIHSIFSNDFNAHYSKFQLRSVLKYKFSKPENKVLYYVFLDGFANLYTKHFNQKGQYYYSDGIDLIYDKADMKINKVGFNIGNGLEVKIHNRIYLDFYFGLGLAERIVEYENVVNPQKHFYISSYSGITYNYKSSQPISKSVLSAKSGVNIIYKLGKSNRKEY